MIRNSDLFYSRAAEFQSKRKDIMDTYESTLAKLEKAKGSQLYTEETEKAEKAKKDAEEKKKKEPPKLSMQEEIALKMGKLKKVGDVKVEQKVDNKKAAPQESMMDLLKKQINLRFQNLNKHQEEDSDDEDDEESD